MSLSRLYEGTVIHERRGDPNRSFTFRVAMLLVDLDEISELASLSPLWRAEHWAPMSYRRADFMGVETTSLTGTVRDIVEQRAGFRPDGPIRLLAHHRTWGWVFNPIAIYYCYAHNGETLQAVVADVTNTPWGESHAYVIDTREGGNELAEQSKSLHVSPFLPMDLTYRFRLSEPAADCSFSVTVHRDAEVVFRAVLALRQRPMTRRAIAVVLVRYPFLTHRVSFGIYQHAARLWLHRTAFYRHPPIVS